MEKNFFDGRTAALIDMDGVLYDSMPGHTLAWKKMMESVGVSCDRDEFYLYEGMTGQATIDLLFEREFGHPCDPEKGKELYALKSRFFREMGPARKMPGAGRMLRLLAEGGLRRVLVTGSGQKSLLEALSRDYPGVFAQDCRVTAHDVRHGKPDPEPYLMGASKAGADPAQCVVVENAPLGVRAGKSAGCFTIAVTTGPIPREAFEKEGADLIFDSMDRFADFLESELDRRYESGYEVVQSRVVFTSDLRASVGGEVSRLRPDKVFMLTDRNVAAVGLPEVDGPGEVMAVDPGESSKSIETACGVWKWLTYRGATRRSLLLNVGGGVVTDLGGFVAATFKRGIRFINVPTTILGAADAAVGGKTGVDFNGFKNEIGAFADAAKVIVCDEWFRTLPGREVKSGFAEIVKMALVADAGLYEALLEGDALADPGLFRRALRHAIRAKEDVVRLDPYDKGLRRILNFGHTAGHAYEEYAASIGQPVTHGEAVAHGMLYALELSRDREGFPAEEVVRYRERILERYYDKLPFGPEADAEIMRLMGHDKKNSTAGQPRFVLLHAPASPVIQ